MLNDFAFAVFFPYLCLSSLAYSTLFFQPPSFFLQQEKPPHLILLYLIFAQLNRLILLNTTYVALILTLATLLLIYLIPATRGSGS